MPVKWDVLAYFFLFSIRKINEMDLNTGYEMRLLHSDMFFQCLHNNKGPTDVTV